MVGGFAVGFWWFLCCRCWGLAFEFSGAGCGLGGVVSCEVDAVVLDLRFWVDLAC